jgi:hypothetical protein
MMVPSITYEPFFRPSEKYSKLSFRALAHITDFTALYIADGDFGSIIWSPWTERPEEDDISIYFSICHLKTVKNE